MATTKLGQSEHSTLRIGFVSSVLYGCLPILVRKFRCAYPKVKLQFSELTSLEQIRELKAGRIDVGFGRVRVYDPAIARVVLREERLALARSEEHPSELQSRGHLVCRLLPAKNNVHTYLR